MKYRMGSGESIFADLIWTNEPISSGQLAQKARGSLQWKKTTSFTVLKRLCDRGLFQNCQGVVTSIISREDYYANHSKQYVEEMFGGSLPAFLTAFSSNKKLSDEEIDNIQKMIDSMKEK